jgi:hypothetical protein
MYSRCFAVVMMVGACGTVTGDPSDGGTATTYRGTLDQTSPVTFGGDPYCSYTITLKQLDVELGILPSSHQVTTGRVQDLNLEASLPPCTLPTIPPGIATYTLASAAPSATGTKLTFQGAADNAPVASLGINLSPSGSTYQATLTFQRTDSEALLNWSVIATIPLTAQ